MLEIVLQKQLPFGNQSRINLHGGFLIIILINIKPLALHGSLRPGLEIPDHPQRQIPPAQAQMKHFVGELN